MKTPPEEKVSVFVSVCVCVLELMMFVPDSALLSLSEPPPSSPPPAVKPSSPHHHRLNLLGSSHILIHTHSHTHTHTQIHHMYIDRETKLHTQTHIHKYIRHTQKHKHTQRHYRGAFCSLLFACIISLPFSAEPLVFTTHALNSLIPPVASLAQIQECCLSLTLPVSVPILTLREKIQG